MRQANSKNKKILTIAAIGFLFLMCGSAARADEMPTSTDNIVINNQTTDTTTVELPITSPSTTEQQTITPPDQYQVTVNYIGENIFSNTVTPTSTWFVDVNQNIYTNEKVTALGALAEASRQGQFPIEIQNYGYGYYVSSISNHAPVGFDGWVYNVNQTDPGWFTL